MNTVATRIYEKMNSLLKQKEEAHHAIKKITQEIDATKKSIHRDEVEIAVESAATHAIGMPNFLLAKDIRDISKHRHVLHDKERELKDLNEKHSQLIRLIDTHTYWLHRADTPDIARQQEAEKQIFG